MYVPASIFSPSVTVYPVPPATPICFTPVYVLFDAVGIAIFPAITVTLHVAVFPLDFIVITELPSFNAVTFNLSPSITSKVAISAFAIVTSLFVILIASPIE